jgi:hypothetical protein
MSYICNGTVTGRPVPHNHELVEDAKYCWGILRQAAPTPPPVPVFRFGSKADPNGPLSPFQHKYVGDLGGDQEHAKTLSYAQCSDYISELIRAKRNGGTVEPQPQAQPTTQREPAPPNPTLQMIEALLPVIPEGYYAVRKDGNQPYTFIRYTLPEKGKFKGSWKFQEVIGCGRTTSGRLEQLATRWSSGRWSWYEGLYGKYGKYGSNQVHQPTADLILLICADHQGAAQAYADEVRRCRRCNTLLTDEESRWYGIGPECVKHRPDVVDTIDSSPKGRYPHKSARFSV